MGQFNQYNEWVGFCENLKKRQSIRDFSSSPPDIEVVMKCLDVANTAPSGANLQPWHFALIKSPTIKKEIREKAESVELDFYQQRAPKEWLDALRPFQTNECKPFLEEAPYLIVIFYCPLVASKEGGIETKTYFPIESTGLATGFLLTTLHQAGLATLTYTPKPCSFLNEICDRPKSDRVYMLIVTGFPKDEKTPFKEKKPLTQKMSVH